MPWLIAANSILVSVCLAIHGWVVHGTSRIALKTPLSKICDLEPGLASIQGRVKPIDSVLESPMSGANCVYYHFTVVETKVSGEDSSSKTLVDDREYAPFQISDDTGEVNVDLESATLQLNSTSASSKQRDLYNLMPQLRGKWGHPTTGTELRYNETIIRVGADLYVLGMVSSKPNCLPQFEKRQGPYVISDKTKHEVVAEGRLEGGVGLIASGVFAIAGLIILAASKGTTSCHVNGACSHP